MAEVKWIKIVTDVFDDEKIRFIETLPQGDSIIVVWFKLLCMCGKANKGGFLMMTDKIAYTDDLLSSIFNKDIKFIQLCLNTFKSLDMIEVINDKYFISNWEKHQSIEKLEQIRETTRKRVAKYREKQQQLESICNVTVTQDVTLCNAIDIDIDKDIEYIYNVDLVFDTFWNNYPRKESKSKTKEWFKKHKPKQELLDKMIKSINEFKKTAQWQNKEFIPHPITWLNQKRWEDEIDLSGNLKDTSSGKGKSPTPDWYDEYEKDLEKTKKQEMTQEEIKKILEEAKEKL